MFVKQAKGSLLLIYAYKFLGSLEHILWLAMRWLG